MALDSHGFCATGTGGGGGSERGSARGTKAPPLRKGVKSETGKPFSSASSALQHVWFSSIFKHVDGILGGGGGGGGVTVAGKGLN